MPRRRLRELGRQLARRGLDDLAVEKFTEAQARPASPGGPPGPGRPSAQAPSSARRRDPLPGRARRAAGLRACGPGPGLRAEPARRGRLVQAERRVRDLLAQNPSQARAHFLLGPDLRAAPPARRRRRQLQEGGRACSWNARKPKRSETMNHEHDEDQERASPEDGTAHATPSPPDDAGRGAFPPTRHRRPGRALGGHGRLPGPVVPWPAADRRRQQAAGSPARPPQPRPGPVRRVPRRAT